MCLSCTVPEILSLISPNLKKSCDPEHIPFGVVYHARASIDATSPKTLFCVSGCSVWWCTALLKDEIIARQATNIC